MLQKELLAKDYAAIGEQISHEQADSFISAFRQAHPSDAQKFTVGRNIIDQILSQPGCRGLRFYNALNEAGQQTVVYVGVDAEGKDLVERTVVMSNGDIATSDGMIGDRVPWFFW